MCPMICWYCLLCVHPLLCQFLKLPSTSGLPALRVPMQSASLANFPFPLPVPSPSFPFALSTPLGNQCAFIECFLGAHSLTYTHSLLISSPGPLLSSSFSTLLRPVCAPGRGNRHALSAYCVLLLHIPCHCLTGSVLPSLFLLSAFFTPPGCCFCAHYHGGLWVCIKHLLCVQSLPSQLLLLILSAGASPPYLSCFSWEKNT